MKDVELSVHAHTEQHKHNLRSMIHECMPITREIKRKVTNLRGVKGVERKEGVAGRS